MKKVAPIVWGLVILALGVIFGGNAIGLFNIDVFFDGWWTLFIIVPSFISMITEGRILSNLVMIAGGVLLLLAAQGIFTYEVAWKAIGAVVLIAVGLYILYRAIFRNNGSKEVEKKIKELNTDEKSMDSQMAVFAGNDRVYNKEVFNGSNLTAVFGGVKLDLRKAEFKKDTVIKAFAMFGGIEIYAPKDIDVKVRSGFFFGGFEDERADAAKGKYTIYIDAAGGFGGVSIKDKDDD